MFATAADKHHHSLLHLPRRPASFQPLACVRCRPCCPGLLSVPGPGGTASPQTTPAAIATCPTSKSGKSAISHVVERSQVGKKFLVAGLHPAPRSASRRATRRPSHRAAASLRPPPTARHPRAPVPTHRSPQHTRSAGGGTFLPLAAVAPTRTTRKSLSCPHFRRRERPRSLKYAVRPGFRPPCARAGLARAGGGEVQPEEGRLVLPRPHRRL